MNSPLSILMIGDIVGKHGMLAVRKSLPKVVAENRIDFVIANGENTAGGVGITPDLAKELLHLGADCITTGNHIWRQREIRDYIERENRLLRPHNFGNTQPGSGIGRYRTAGGILIGVINLAGRVFMEPADNPFKTADSALKSLSDIRVILVDFHAEATSEKKAMGHYLAGRVSAVVGTHTHVQTADEMILAPGSAYLTDMGMTGPHDSVIGMRKDLVLDRFVNGLPHSFQPAKGDIRFQGVVIQIDRETGYALSIRRLDLSIA